MIPELPVLESLQSALGLPVAWVGGRLVRHMAGLERSSWMDLDVAIVTDKEESQLQLQVRELTAWAGPLCAWRIPKQRPLSPGSSLRLELGSFITEGANPVQRLDLIPTRSIESLVARFDVNVTRVWGVFTGDSLTVHHFENEPVLEDIRKRRVFVIPGTWTRPWREGKYRQILGSGPRKDYVLPLVRPPKAGDPPPGFRWITSEEMCPPPRPAVFDGSNASEPSEPT